MIAVTVPSELAQLTVAPAGMPVTSTYWMVSEPSVSASPTVIGTAITVSSVPDAEPEPVGTSASADTTIGWLMVVVAVELSKSIVRTAMLRLTLLSPSCGGV